LLGGREARPGVQGPALALRGGFGELEEEYVLSFPAHQRPWVREPFRRNAAQLEALKELMN
jgi:hypothetical protein